MRHIISVLLENEAGALSRVVGLFSARGYNIETLTVAPTEDSTLSRMTIVTHGDESTLEQIVKQLSKLPGAMATRIEDKLLELEHDPRPSGCKKLRGRDARRIRIGDYRAIYEIHDGRLVITVITVGHRREVYE